MTERTRVGILGATGMVGQHFVSLLEDHPWFELTWLAASERSAGKRYGEMPWRLAGNTPSYAANLPIHTLEVVDEAPPLLFSALDSSVAGDAETAFARAGRLVVSNARNHRMDPLVPLLIPEVNPDHLKLIPLQQESKNWKGAIVTNPNCATVVLAMALAPLRQFGINKVCVTTMQAVSGAGYPGVASLDILGNIIPFIGGGEEEKIETETLKILGADGGRSRLNAVISAQVNRVPVIDGHTMTVSVQLLTGPSVDDVVTAMRTFSGQPQALKLPTAPAPPIVVMTAENRPQPRLDAGLGDGMTTTVGRVRTCPVLTHKFVALSHNTIRGAAGASILNAELMKAQGLLN